jgi:CheY-like chemotaxis protein
VARVQRTCAAGCDVHLAKPVDADDLITVLSDVARASQQR